MGLGVLIALIVIGYLMKDVLKFVVIIGLIAFVAIYKLEALSIGYEAIVNLLGYLKGVLG